MHISRTGISFAIGFAVIEGLVFAQHFEGSWGGFLIFLLALPASLLALIVGGHPIALLIAGLVQWYWIGSVIDRVRRSKSESTMETPL